MHLAVFIQTSLRLLVLVSLLSVKTAQLQSDQTVTCCNADGFFSVLLGGGQRGNIASILDRVSLFSTLQSKAMIITPSLLTAWQCHARGNSPPHPNVGIDLACCDFL